MRSLQHCKHIALVLVVAFSASALAQNPFRKKEEAREAARERLKEAEERQAAPAKAPAAAAQPAAQPAPAGGKDLVYVPMREFESAEQAQQFLDLAYRKQVTEEDISVLERLQSEKQTEFRQMNGQLQKEFNMDPERDYEYDADKKELTLKPLEKDGESTVLVTLDDKAREGLFLRLIAAKRLTSNALATLELLVLEKKKEVELIDAKLLDEYSIHAEKDYYYDAARRSLFQVVAKDGP